MFAAADVDDAVAVDEQHDVAKLLEDLAPGAVAIRRDDAKKPMQHDDRRKRALPGRLGQHAQDRNRRAIIVARIEDDGFGTSVHDGATFCNRVPRRIS